MKSVAFLHTADAHIATFDKLFESAALDIVRTHAAHPEWLSEAQKSGLSEDLRARVTALLIDQARCSDAVLCTCSTIGPIADQVAATHKNVFRIDRPLMERASQHNGSILVAICVESTLKPTIDLLTDVFEGNGKVLDYKIVRCDAAWPHFWAGEMEAFGTKIASAIKQACEASSKLGCVVLAQASMAAAQPYLADLEIPVYASPSAALDTILQSINTDKS